MSRKAFTLVELLVVFAIFVLLMAMVLPAIQKVRAASDILICLSNMKQIGLALHDFHVDYQRFPEGVRSGSPNFRMTWLTQLLPYIEKDNLWKKSIIDYSVQPIPFISNTHTGLYTPVKMYSCPSDVRMGTAHSTHMGFYVAHTSYLGVLGTNYLSTNGVLYLDSKTKITDIHDGSSNTIIVGERPPSSDYWFGWWYAGGGQAATGSCDMLLGSNEINIGDQYTSQCPRGPYSFKRGNVDDQSSVFYFWSLHISGANFLFGDGSVRMIPYETAPYIIPALSTRSGGEIVFDDY